MAGFQSKLDLTNNKFYQGSGDTLSLCGSNAIGCAHYLTDKSSYFDITPRAIPDVSWVTGKTSTSGLQTANNGLTKQGTNVKLGGNLTGDTIINGVSNAHRLTLSTDSAHVSPYAEIIAGCGLSFPAAILSSCNGGCNAVIKTEGNQALISGTGNFAGAQYCVDYSANFTSLSLVTKQYVLSEITGGTGIANANNGLTKVGNRVILGGALTGATTLTAVNSTSLTFTDSRTTPIGIQYGSDYSANFTARSLVDAGYVTGKTSQANCAIAIAPVAITGVTNGLTKVGSHSACLGGNLTGNVSVTPVGAFGLTLGTATNKVIVTTGSTSVCNQTGNEINGALFNSSQAGLFTVDAVASKFAYQTLCGTNPSICTAVINASCAVSTCLTPNTMIICGCPATFAGAQYGVDYSANFTCLSLVTKGFVTGCTNAITTNFVCSANNGLTKQGTNVKLGGTLTGNTCITGAYEFDLNTNKVNITGSTGGVNLGGSGMKITATVPGSGGLLCLGAGGVVCQTSLSAFGGITGATNGLSTCGCQQVGLGGSLCADTIVNSGAGSRKLTLGKFCGLNLATSGGTDLIAVAQGNGGIWIKSESGTGAIGNSTANAVGIGMDFNGTNGFQVFDNRTSTGQTGIVYAADYSLNYIPRSLVDKGYVDSVATGLNVHQAVCAATTGPITLSGNQSIDGFMTTTGNRILVKNQVAGATNGIYTANSVAWSRASDYTGNTQVTNGDLIPVTTGDTQNSSIWVLTTPDPITVGVTSLVYSEFSTIIDVQQGPGIAITQVGGVHTVCVELGNCASSGCGLAVSSQGLCIASSIAGSGLTFNGSVLKVNATPGGTAASLPIEFYNNCLVIDCADINSALNAITGATNGLTKQNQLVKLGGTITGATTLILSASGAPSLLFTDSRVGGAAVGLQYTANYDANFTARSLVDAAYVTGKTTTAGLQTANNGLTKQGTNVRLGGLLTGDTSICGASGNSLFLGTSGSMLKCFNVCASCNVDLQFGVGKNFTIQSPTTVYLTVCESAGDIASLRDLAGSCFGLNGSCLNINGAGGAMTVSDTASKGLVYGGSYEANFTDLSLVDKFFVNNAITGSTLVFNNGLTKAGKTVSLGGSLTGNTTVGAGSNTLSFNLGCFIASGTSGFKLESGSCKAIICTTTDGAGSMSLCGGGFGAKFGGAGVFDYCADYSNCLAFNARTIVDAGYVTGKTSQANCAIAIAPKAITGATNGLCKYDCHNACLGGSLTGPVMLNLNGQIFNICGAPGHDFINLNDSSLSACFGTDYASTTQLRNNAYSLTLSSSPFANFNDCTNVGLCYGGDYEANFVNRSLVTKRYVLSEITGGTGIANANNGLTKVGNTVILGGALTGTTTINGGTTLRINVTNLELSGNTAINLTGEVTLETPPPAGVPLVDAVLVWNSSDKQIKTVSGAALGDKNNVYSNTLISSSQSLTTGSSYVILVDTTGGPINVCLPATPVEGEAFKIKDVCNTALLNNITVVGNGACIDGASIALINTDFGALELMYTTSPNGWYTLGFVN